MKCFVFEDEESVTKVPFDSVSCVIYSKVEPRITLNTANSQYEFNYKSEQEFTQAKTWLDAHLSAALDLHEFKEN